MGVGFSRPPPPPPLATLLMTGYDTPHVMELNEKQPAAMKQIGTFPSLSISRLKQNILAASLRHVTITIEVNEINT